MSYTINTHAGKPIHSAPSRASSWMTAFDGTMERYRCACGKTESVASIPPFPCEACPECHSTLGQRPDQIRQPVAHDYGVWGRCVRCHMPSLEALTSR